jgi:cation:H+ antiporter
VAFGNIVGSNIFNILGILGVTAAITPLDIPSRIAGIDIWLMLGVTLVAVVFSITGWRVSRWEGLLLVCGYVAYMAILFLPL